MHEALLARAESIAAASHDWPELAEARCYDGDNLRTQGQYEQARRAFATADTILHAAPDPDIEATCLQLFADLENELGNWRASAPAIRRAIAIRDGLGRTGDTFYADLLSTLAYAFSREGRPRDAVRTYLRAERVMDSTGRGAMMDRAVIEHDLAIEYLSLGETAGAERLLHDVLERVRRADPSGHLPVQALIHYARAALFARDLDSARQYFALLARQAAREHNPYWQGRALFGLAEADIAAGDLRAARRTMARFLPLSANPALKRTDDEVMDYRMLEALLARARGDTATARERAVQVLQAVEHRDVGMVERRRAHAQTGVRVQRGAGGEIVEGDVGAEHIDRHRKQRRRHRPAQGLLDGQILRQIAAPDDEGGRLIEEHRSGGRCRQLVGPRRQVGDGSESAVV